MQRRWQIARCATATLYAAVVIAAASCGGAPGAATGVTAPPTSSVAACRLPIGATSDGLGGFLAYPSGTYSPDPTSKLMYNARHQRWLPSPVVASPDGSTVVRADHPKLAQTTSLVAVDIASGAARPIAVVAGNAEPLAWLGSGIYYLEDQVGADSQLGVVNPTNGVTRVVAGQSNATGLPLFKASTVVNGGAAWSKTVENSGPSGDVLVRVDLASGRAEVWFRDQSISALDVLGFSADGNPLVTISSGQSRRLALLTGPGMSLPVLSRGLQPATTAAPGVEGVSDGHGLWLLASDGGIWLFADRGLHRVGAAPLPPAITPTSDTGPFTATLLLAGPCT